MKIIIDIDDEQVLFDIENRSLEAQTETDKVIINALYNGTPLPKNHGRLIDADDAISKICGISCGCNLMECGYDRPCFSIKRIQSAHTIIEAESEE